MHLNTVLLRSKRYKKFINIKSTKMTEGGYSKDRFTNLQGQIFDCLVCLDVVRNPKECSNCGNLFCSKCIDDWMMKNASCPNRCPGNNISPMTAKALIKIYQDLDLKCSKCPSVVKLGDLAKHEEKCGLIKCDYHEQCGGYQNKAINVKSGTVCSDKCSFLKSLLDTKGDHKSMFKLLSAYSPKEDSKLNSGQNLTRINLAWNNKQCCMNATFSGGNSGVFLKEEAYVFRSVVCAEGFMSGCHYWEIHPDARTQNELKIGVTSKNIFDFNSAFCDHPFGFAFYGLAQLRHASNATGNAFGKRFKKTGILGVYLNMNRGTLSFALNGEDMGVAFTDPSLTQGPQFPAVALLHCGGCIIKGELPIPKIYQGK